MTFPSITFTLNQRLVTVTDQSPMTSLVDYLHHPLVGLRGTKIGCREGGCGSCTVLLTRLNPLTSRTETVPVTACLVPIASLDNTAVTTIEGVSLLEKLPAGKPTELQTSLSAHNATQCGYCTPGFIMSMYGLQISHPKASQERVEHYFGGNLCRCTGYADLLVTARENSQRDQPLAIPALTINQHPVVNKTSNFNDCGVFKPQTEAEFVTLLSHIEQSGLAYRFVAGNTGLGVFKGLDDENQVFISLSAFSTLGTIDQVDGYLRVGALVTFNQLSDYLRLMAKPLNRWAMVHDHLQKIGSQQIRNLATVGGSIGLMDYVRRTTQPEKPLPIYGSDWATLAVALQAEISIGVGSANRRLLLETYLLEPPTHFPELINALFLPLKSTSELAVSYRIAFRPQNASAQLNAVFHLQLTTDLQRIVSASVVFGAVGYAPLRARNVEAYLQDLSIQEGSLAELKTLLASDLETISFGMERSLVSEAYKKAAAAGLLTKWWLVVRNRLDLSLHNETSGAFSLVRSLSSQKDDHIYVEYFDDRLAELGLMAPRINPAFCGDSALAIVGENLVAGMSPQAAVELKAIKPPISAPKISALLQAQGQATYTYDLPGPSRTLHAYYIFARLASGTYSYPGGLARFRQEIEQRPGVQAYIAFDSIPEAARTVKPYKDGFYFLPNSSPGVVDNINNRGNYDPAFAQYDSQKELGYVSCYGQPIGLVVAESFTLAKRIAREFGPLIEVTPADGTVLEKPVFELRAILSDSLVEKQRLLTNKLEYKAFSRFEDEPSLAWLNEPIPLFPAKVSTELSTTWVELMGHQETGAQYHFYMEPQVALAIPGEEGSMTIYSSSQYLTRIQDGVSAILGVPSNRITVKTSRLGGAFGGKELRPRFYAAAAAVAANALQQPVKLALDRETDALMTGTRHPYTGFYRLQAEKVGEGDQTKIYIRKWRVEYYSNAGISFDCSLPIMDLVLLDADGNYNVPNFNALGKTYRTNFPSRTAFRSFGLIQGSLIREEAVEHLAHVTGVDADLIRETNFYADATATSRDTTPYGQPLIDCRINDVWTKLKEKASYEQRKKAVVDFNHQNRWKKRGIAMIPIKYGISYTHRPSNFATAIVYAYGTDGSIVINHGGIEMGQGLDTKILMLAAGELGLRYNGSVSIRLGPSDTSVIANPRSSGASTTADLNGGAVVEACRQLRERLEAFLTVDESSLETSAQTYFKPDTPLSQTWQYLRQQVRAKLDLNERIYQNGLFSPEKQQFLADWAQQWEKAWPYLAQLAYNNRIDLTAEGFFKSENFGVIKDGKLTDPTSRIFYYYTYSAAASEVEIDVLTGEFTVRRTDLVYDAGMSLNEQIDFGQIKGAFIQGIGNVTTEYMAYDEKGGPLTNSSWNYKVPCSLTIPEEFNVYLLSYIPTNNQQKAPLDRYGIQSSKSTGEPPLVLATSVFFALKRAILAARQELGRMDWFDLPAPATVPNIFTYANCLEQSV